MVYVGGYASSPLFQCTPDWLRDFYFSTHGPRLWILRRHPAFETSEIIDVVQMESCHPKPDDCPCDVFKEQRRFRMAKWRPRSWLLTFYQRCELFLLSFRFFSPEFFSCFMMSSSLWILEDTYSATNSGSVAGEFDHWAVSIRQSASFHRLGTATPGSLNHPLMTTRWGPLSGSL